MFGPEYMNGRRAADHEDDGAFDNTSGLVNERLAGGWNGLWRREARDGGTVMLMLTNLRDKQSIGKIGRGFLGLRFLEIQTQCASCDGATKDRSQ